MTDLFGNKVPDFEVYHPHRLLFQVLPHYRPSESKEVRCDTCANCRRWEQGNKRFRKCALVNGGMPSSERTDIRARWVCDAWEKTEEVQG